MGSRLLLFGDLCTDNEYRHLLGEGREVFSADLRELMMSADAVIGNLECPVAEAGTPAVKCGPNLRAHPKGIDYFKRSGFTAFSMANNHILDYGEQALIETCSHCTEAGISFFGAGEDRQAAEKPYILDTADGRIAFLSFAEEEFNISGDHHPGAALFDPYASFDRIRELKQSVGRVIILYHGGIEHYIYPTPLLQKKCRKMVEAGADLVLCQHSHCIGTIEKHGCGTIVYGQGNSLFGYREGRPAWNEGLLLELDPDTMEIHYHLLSATADGVQLGSAEACEKRLLQVIRASECLQDDALIQAEWDKFVEKQAALYYPLLYGRSRLFNKINRLFNNKPAHFLFGKKARMITMNLIRCDAHRELITTMLEHDFYDR